ncbi:hypothetical protein DMUE_1810, partial [Dictyocoela muelleri]
KNLNKNSLYKFKKSFLETYFQYGYVNLSSSDNRNIIARNENFFPENKNYLEFEIQIEGLNEKLKQKMLIIDNFKEIDFIKWLKDFETLSTTNKWNDKIKYNVACALIKDESIDLGECAEK